MTGAQDGGSAREGPGPRRRRRRRDAPSEPEDGGPLGFPPGAFPESIGSDAGKLIESGRQEDHLTPVEDGGQIQPQGLPEHGRIKIVWEKLELLIEGTTPVVIIGSGVLGSLGGGYIATLAHGFVPGLVIIVAVSTMVLTYLLGRRA